MISVRYCGPWRDSSGYGDASRSFINALYSVNVNITTELVVQMPVKTHYGLSEQVCLALQNRNIPYKIKIIHLTGDMLPRYMETGKYHISHMFWECDRLPQSWINPLNLMNEVWCASERQANMLKKSGVKCAIYWFPQPINTIYGEENITPFETRYKKDFTFYTIQQFIDRKNFKTLVKAYSKAFEEKNDVTLLIKTYKVNYSEKEFNEIKTNIHQWRQELNLKHYPHIDVIKKLLQHSGMSKLHALGDVYVSSSSSEAWNRPIMEAMLYGKPVISGDNGGITDYLTTDHYFRVPSVPVNATESPHIPWYTKDMLWWELKEDELVNMMRHVYEHREEIPDKVNRAKDWVLNNCNYQVLGQKMKERLSQIEKIL